MTYDRADWHYGGDFPADLPQENGATHIGMFLAWAVLNGLEGDLLREHCSGALDAVRQRTMTGRQFLLDECDEKLTDGDLNQEGNAFAAVYCDKDSGYLSDYARVLAVGVPSLYHVADTWDNYDRIAPLISKAFMRWKAGTPWWQFWRR
jgi:hypothetical protein